MMPPVHSVVGGNIEDARRYGLTLLAECGAVFVPPNSDTFAGRDDCPTCWPEGRLTGSDQRPHFVYRCYGEDGALLYIGCTVDLATRRLSHAATSWWFPQMASYRATIYPSKFAARRVEREAIASERPLWNVRHQHFEEWGSDGLRRLLSAATELGAPKEFGRRIQKLVNA